MYHSWLGLHWISFEFKLFHCFPFNLTSICCHFLMPQFTFLVLTCKAWQSQGRPPYSQNHLGRPPHSRRPLRMSVTTSKMRPCSNSMKTSFKNCRRPTPFNASRAWGYCQRWSPILTFRYAERSTCHPTLAHDIKRLEAEFTHGYRPGVTVFYVSITNEHGEERHVKYVDTSN
jgi:hypothetical protein